MAVQKGPERNAAGGDEPPFRISVRIGKPIMPAGDPSQDTEQLRDGVAGLMQRIPGFRPAPGETLIRLRNQIA